MSILHLNLAIMMIFVERRAVADGTHLDAHATAHAAGADAHAPVSHIALMEHEISLFGQQTT
jgi:dUTPase